MGELKYTLTHEEANEAMEKGYAVELEALHGECDPFSYELRNYEVFHVGGRYWGSWNDWRSTRFTGRSFCILHESTTCPACGKDRVIIPVADTMEAAEKENGGQ